MRINTVAKTHIALDHEPSPGLHRAVGYTMKDGDVETSGSSDVAWKAAGGGLISTVVDFARYCAALEGDELLRPADKTLLWTGQKDARGKSTGYGIGFEVGVIAGERHVGHNGAQEKTRTWLSLYPERQLCVVAMTNSEYADIDAIGAALDRAALAATPR